MANAVYILLTILGVPVLTVAAARVVNRFRLRIDSKYGIKENIYVKLGGIEQYIQIRGKNNANPIIVFLHGGPGSPAAFYSYCWQTPLERDFTVVHWDQRGSGRTYYRNVKSDGCGDLSLNLLLSDLNELVDYLLKRFGQQKLVIMGHSWGTYLGSHYIARHPEKVSAYIGTGQVVKDGRDKLAAEVAAKRAVAAGNAHVSEQIIAAEQQLAANWTISAFQKLNRLTKPYLKPSEELPFFKLLLLSLTSPDMNFHDLKWYLFFTMNGKGYSQVNRTLSDIFNELKLNEQLVNYAVPMYYIIGDCDWVTPHSFAHEYFTAVSAPRKEFVTMKNTGHSPFLDKRDEYCKAVINLLK